MASCQTITGPDQVLTEFVSSVGSTVVVSTGSAQTVTTSTPVLITTCPTATACPTNTTCEAAPCTTSTSFDPVTSTIPESVQSLTSFFTNVKTILSTSPGAVSTSCSSISLPPSSTTPPPFTTPPPSPTPTPTTAPPPTTEEFSTITQFSIVLLTLTDNSGRVSTSTSIALLQPGKSGTSSKANPGTIAGGVVGGIAGLLMVVGLLWFLKSRGFLRRDGDEHFTEDMWKPPAHSPGVVVGARADDEDGDGAANHSGDSGGMMSEKDGAVMVGGQGNRQSWYGVSVDGAAGAYRSTSPEVEGYGPQAGYRDSRQPEYDARSYGDRLSHRQSMQSHSSHSHDGFGSQHSPSSFSHIPLPDHRLSQQQYYQHMSQVAQQPGSFGFALYDGRREELAAEGSDSADHSESGRTAATTGSSNGFASSHSQRGAPRPDLPVETRPTLPVIEGSYNSSSSSSAPSSSIPSSDTPSSDVPSAEASNTFLPQDSLAESERIKSFKSRLRPGMMARSESADSFKVPSQFLGARIANATPTEEKAEFTFEQSGLSYLSGEV